MVNERSGTAGTTRTAVLPLLLPLTLLSLLAVAQEAPAEPGAPADPAAVEERRPEGWFTAEQAEEGRAAYVGNCARCHSPDLRARSTYISLYRYPALRGAYFLDRWEGESVHTLAQVIRHTMPLDAPGTLDEETYAAIVAYILQVNGFPAGGAALPPAVENPERLRGMIIEPASMVELPSAQEPRAVQLVAASAPRDRDAPPAREQQPVPVRDLPTPAEQPLNGAWYTVAQAMRGDALFVENCARCHGRALQGVGVAPSLAGGNFIDRWEGSTVGDLFHLTVSLMPLDGQGSLEPQAHADLLAYVLWSNGYPHGDTELPPDIDRLHEYVITSDLAEVPQLP